MTVTVFPHPPTLVYVVTLRVIRLHDQFACGKANVRLWTGHEFGQNLTCLTCECVVFCMFLMTPWWGATFFIALCPAYVLVHLDVFDDIGVGATGVTFMSTFFLAMEAVLELSSTVGIER